VWLLHGYPVDPSSTPSNWTARSQLFNRRATALPFAGNQVVASLLDCRNQREHNMPIYHFHVDNGEFTPDSHGIELPNLTAARREAVRAAGEIINESNRSFWEHMTPWIMNVTDSEDRLLFTLQFGAKVPSGSARYIPSTKEPEGSGST